MKIVLFSDYYYPTIKSGSIVIKDLATELTRLGHEAMVITFNENQKDFLTKEKNGSITIIRLRSRLRKFGMIGRLLSELRYSSSIIKGLKIIENDNIDGIICFSPSIFYHKAISWLKNEYQIKAYLIVRDIFPKWLLDAGILKEGPLFRFFRKEEIKLYNSVDFIGIESIKDLDYFKSYIDANTHLEVLDNWGSSFDINQIVSHDSSPLPKGLINIIYGGNMADAQDLYSLLDDLDDSVLEGKAFITSDVGQHQMFAAQYYFFDKPRQWINSGGLGTMGFGLPSAMGVQFAFPEDTVACVTGEGSIQMCIQELSTCFQYGLPIKIINLNNAALGMVKQWQDMQYGGRHSASTYENSLPDFCALSESYGHVGIKVTKLDELESAMKECISLKDKLVFLDVDVDPDEHVYPMLEAGNAMDYMHLSKDKKTW